jgi:hypothetical protein
MGRVRTIPDGYPGKTGLFGTILLGMLAVCEHFRQDRFFLFRRDPTFFLKDCAEVPVLPARYIVLHLLCKGLLDLFESNMSPGICDAPETIPFPFRIYPDGIDRHGSLRPSLGERPFPIHLLIVITEETGKIFMIRGRNSIPGRSRRRPGSGWGSR